MRVYTNLLVGIICLSSCCCNQSPPTESERSEKTLGGRQADKGAKDAFSPDEVTRILEEHYKGIVVKAIGEAIGKGFEEVNRKLGIKDEIERSLMKYKGDEFIEEPQEDASYSILVLREGSSKDPPETVTMSNGKTSFRFTRITGPVEKPLALLTYRRNSPKDSPVVEVYLEYSSKAGWKGIKIKERVEEIGK